VMTRNGNAIVTKVARPCVIRFPIGFFIPVVLTSPPSCSTAIPGLDDGCPSLESGPVKVSRI
jgi:hypothetical protein